MYLEFKKNKVLMKELERKYGKGNYNLYKFYKL